MATKRRVTKRAVVKRTASAKAAPVPQVPEVLLEAADFFDAGQAAQVIAVVKAHPGEDWLPFAMGLLRSMAEGAPPARACAVQVLTALPALTEDFRSPDVFLAACVAQARAIAEPAALALETDDLRPDGLVQTTVRGWREHGHPELADFADRLLPSAARSVPAVKA